MRGRPPKPTALKRLAGNPGRRPLAREPAFKPLASAPPQWLGQDGRNLWFRLAGTLAAAGVITQADEMALEMLCRSYEAWLDAERHLRDGGPVVIRPPKNGRAGGMGLSPWVKEAERLFQQLERVAAKFGLTPADRAKVAHEAQASDTLDSFINSAA